MTKINPQARTTPLIRAEIQASSLSTAELVKLYNSSKSTIAKWRHRTDTSDRSHCQNNLQTTLSKEQELIVVELRRTLLLPLDDMLVVTRKFIHPKASRAGIMKWAPSLGQI
jgi:hypothetical protein